MSEVLYQWMKYSISGISKEMSNLIMYFGLDLSNTNLYINKISYSWLTNDKFFFFYRENNTEKKRREEDIKMCPKQTSNSSKHCKWKVNIESKGFTKFESRYKFILFKESN